MWHRLPPYMASLLVAGLAATAAVGQRLPCSPCGGLAVSDREAARQVLTALPALPEGTLLVIAWPLDLTTAPSPEPAHGLAQAGVIPLLELTFRTPPPLAERLTELGDELEAAARAVRGAPAGSWFQLRWEPPQAPPPESAATELAFLLKRAAVVVTGAAPGGGLKVASGPLPLDPDFLRELYHQEVGAYLDLVALPAGSPERLTAAVEVLAEIDPGKPVLMEGPAPTAPAEVLAEAARLAASGVSLGLFATPEPAPYLPPLAVLAREFAGDVTLDPYSTPRGAAGTEAWSFVRGEDLALRVIARPSAAEQTAGELTLAWGDAQLQGPERVVLTTGEALPLAGARRTRRGFELSVADPEAAVVLRLARPAISELVGEGGVAEELTVASERQIPVEEILRRLQAFEDDQARRLDHYRALNRTHLRFQFGTGTTTFEATLEGPYFVAREGVADWAWEGFYINGVRWRGKKIPEIPLVEPEKAAAPPLEITFDRSYRYRLKGAAVAEGRDCWVIDFEPVDTARAERGKLYRGTVWVDRQLYARVRTRAAQVGLEGEVISNEETLYYQPVDGDGEPASWDQAAYVLPLRTVARQLLSLLNSTTLVERETRLAELSINGPGFDDERQRVASSDLTMVRDTVDGLRYLVADPDSGERVVQEGFSRNRSFLAGGVFYDDARDAPLPLAGVNYFSFDFRDTGAQVNAFFAGPLLTVAAADPDFLGSRWDIGFDAFALGVAGEDQVYRDGREVPGEAVEVLPASLDLKIGRPIGSFFKLRAQYELDYRHYRRADDTDPEFALPSDHFNHSLSLFGRFSRNGYQLDLGGSYNRRSRWEPWGLPGNPDFDPAFDQYLTWQASLSKNWYLPYFQKVGVELNYVDGEDLDRFSKYEFGFFGDTRIHGYQSDRVRAERAYVAHLSYGFEVGQLLRLDAVVDTGWATDRLSGLDNELLAGVGLAGTFVGPWQTVVNIDLGVPVEGPDDGFVAWVVFLKLLDWKWLK